MLIERTSLLTGETRTCDLDISPEQLALYQQGLLIQDAFPNLSADQREFFMTGVTPEEWNLAFGDDEDE